MHAFTYMYIFLNKWKSALCIFSCGWSHYLGRGWSSTISDIAHARSRVFATHLQLDLDEQRKMHELSTQECGWKLFTIASNYRYPQKAIEKCTTLFHYQSHHLCRSLYKVIAKFRFKEVKGNYLAEGIVHPVHKLCGHVFHNAIVKWDITYQSVYQFAVSSMADFCRTPSVYNNAIPSGR